jgi:hypothetical protein
MFFLMIQTNPSYVQLICSTARITCKPGPAKLPTPQTALIYPAGIGATFAKVASIYCDPLLTQKA